MSFWSILKLSFHNLFNNKLRTTLTVIVLFVMSLVVMFVAGFAFSFYDSMTENYDKMLQEEGADLNVRKYDSSQTSGFMEYSFGINEVDGMLDKLEKAELFSVVKLWSDSGGIGNYVYLDDKGIYLTPRAYSARFNSFADRKNYVVRGRMWNASDDNSNNIWLSSALITSFAIGEKVVFEFSDKEFIVAGFIDDSDGSQSWYSNSVYIDYHNFTGTIQSQGSRTDPPYIKSLYAQLLPDANLVFGPSVISALKGVLKEIDDEDGNVHATSSMVENFVMADYMLLGVFALVAFLGAIIILLSVGSVANTIKITVEQNRKFFGMMKAVGMKNGSVRAVVNWQTVIMTVFAVLLATGVAYGLVVSMKSILTMLISSIFGAETIIVCTLNPLIPIVTALVVIGFIFLFTRKSLRSISKMDVISVISEVN